MPLEYASSGPHIHSQDSISGTMWAIAIALAPAAAVGVWLFGPYALYLILGTAVASALIEYPFARDSYSARQPLGDGSAFIAGMILGLSLSPTSAWWVPIVGSLILVLVGKQAFGGLGNNIFNPALVARGILLLSWPDQLTTWISPIDGATGATPLAGLDVGYLELFLGTIPGSLGETSVIAILAGAVFLFARGLITWRVPISVLVGAVAAALLFGMDPVFTVFAGSLMFAAVFMATDMVTSPTGKTSHLVFGFGCGFLTVVIRAFSVYPAGVTFAFLIMNGAAYLMDRIGADPIFGEVELRTRRVYRGVIVACGAVALAVLIGVASTGRAAISDRLTGARRSQEIRGFYPEAHRVVRTETFDSDVEYYRVYSGRTLIGHYTTVSTRGYGGPMQVEAAIDPRGAVTAARIGDHRESPTLGSRVASRDFLQQFAGYTETDREDLLDAIDHVSGATVSSRAVLNAVMTILSARDESTRALAAGGALPAVDDGTYSGTGRGYQGPISVEVTVTGGWVAAISVTEHGETEGIGTRAMSSLTGEIIDQQSLPVDGVAGATGTSRGFREAVADALGAD